MSSTPKHEIYEHLAEVAQALGHANRLELLEHLAQGRRSVDLLAELTGMSVANTSRHLQLLRRARLVDAERRGKQVFYRLAGDAEVVSVLQTLRHLAERNVAEVDRIVRDYFDARDALEPVSREELITRMHSGMVTVLDVRPEAEFALGHLPGAVSMPIEALEDRLAELPKDQEIIAYCRGPYCVMSFEVVSALRMKGYRIRRLEEGFPEWKAAGLEVVTD
ncbi:metalloregulator ArsR/SmtB family transcription factor [uncultured Stenotrophomonas sp.]|jgi:rhodanese-related sulfurtransferase|uniref:ArsR/SmtB family transcription factor n=1 Tax=uncultured Stenotrophomonas sp. TaxID=165438 RepID=UPI000DB3086F|nr:metalloregulator ArsR/SmtB family transcription factor [uncultured Stenotrophomonas sp.]PZU30281.1 MAG: ArsR family transcriptional regulator [Stenotrophomonas sp.]